MKRIKKKFTFIVERTETGFSVYNSDLPVFSTGKTISELYKNITEALNLFLEENNEQVSEKNIQLEIDLKQFFTYYRILNARFLAERIGMNPSLLSQYVKGHKKPSRKQTERILKGIHEIGKELCEINLYTM